VYLLARKSGKINADNFVLHSGVTRRKHSSFEDSPSLSFSTYKMMKQQVKFSRVFTADMQILGSAFCFGIGFLGQRAVMVRYSSTFTHLDSKTSTTQQNWSLSDEIIVFYI
jgi:hypothetical protein